MARGILGRAAGRRARGRDRRRHGRLGLRRAARASAALGSRLTRPMVVCRRVRAARAGRARRRWCSRRATPGNTEETLAAYDDAVARGAPRLVATTGGALAERARARRRAGRADPRRLPAACGDRLLARRGAGGGASGGAAPSVRSRSRRRRRWSRQLAAEWGPDGGEDSMAKSIARALHGTVPVIAGAELAAAAAYRWKCQFNENAELPGVRVGAARGRSQRGRRLGGGGRAGQVLLRVARGPGRAPAQRAARRADGGDRRGRRLAGRARVRRAARRPVERLVSLVLLGDLVSIYAAVLRGADPVDIAAIDGLKAALSAARLGSSPYRSGCWPATVAGHVLHRLRARFRGRGRAQVASIVDGEARGDAPGGTPDLHESRPHRRRSSPTVSLGDASTFVDAARAARAAQKEWARRARSRARARDRAGRPAGRGQQGGAGAAGHARDRQAVPGGAGRGPGDRRHLRLLPRRRGGGCTGRPSRRRCPTSSSSRSACRSAWRRSSPRATSRSPCPAWYLVPAILCGNAVVWKPAEYSRRAGRRAGASCSTRAACPAAF